MRFHSPLLTLLTLSALFLGASCSGCSDSSGVDDNNVIVIGTNNPTGDCPTGQTTNAPSYTCGKNFTLHQNDFLLDEFWQLAPLPNLVTFSACGSSKSHLLEGDEHIGLTTTCLAAGANHVIGSIWNVMDTGMAEIMADFYTLLKQADGETAVSVSQALAQAQRQAWHDGRSWAQWAGFRCTGRP